MSELAVRALLRVIAENGPAVRLDHPDDHGLTADEAAAISGVAEPFDEAERRAWDAILTAMSEIVDLGLSSNSGELTEAVHVLQSFVVQRMLHRHWPAAFSDWFAKGPKGPSGY